MLTGRVLVRLDLSDNPMTSEVAPALAAALAQQPQLRALNLNDTSLTDEGVATVCKGLVGAAPELQVRGARSVDVRGALSVAHFAGVVVGACAVNTTAAAAWV